MVALSNILPIDTDQLKGSMGSTEARADVSQYVNCLWRNFSNSSWGSAIKCELSAGHYVRGSSDHRESVTFRVTRLEILGLLGMSPYRTDFLQGVDQQTPAYSGVLKRSPEIWVIQIRKPRWLVSAFGLGTIH
jgi:hypothetical protein